jgi:sugar phosphate isomerase/epimerase
MMAEDVGQVYVSTACLPGNDPILARLSLYEQHGLHAIELGAGVTVSKRELEKISRTCCSYLVHNYFPPPIEPFVLNLASRDEIIRNRSLDLVRQALTLCKQLGSPFYSVHGGFITDPKSFGKSSFIFPMPRSSSEAEEAMNRFVSSLEVVTQYADSLGIKLLVENNVCPPHLKGKLLFMDADDFEQIFRAIASPSLGILLDTGHLNVTARTLNFDRLSFVDCLSPYIRAFHVHDNNGYEDDHYPARKDSWVIEVLRKPYFADMPVVIEARFNTVKDLSRYSRVLKSTINRG